MQIRDQGEAGQDDSMVIVGATETPSQKGAITSQTISVYSFDKEIAEAV